MAIPQAPCVANPSTAATGAFRFVATPSCVDVYLPEDVSARRLDRLIAVNWNATQRASTRLRVCRCFVCGSVKIPSSIPEDPIKSLRHAGFSPSDLQMKSSHPQSRLVYGDAVDSYCKLPRAMATLSPSLVVHPSLDYASTMALRETESALLYDIHWAQDPFDGPTDLPLVDVPAQNLEIGYNRFTADQLRCANNCSADWGALFDDAMRSKNFRRIRLRERHLFFEVNRRWPIPSGPQHVDLQANRLRVWIEVMWFFHMMRCLRFGLAAPEGLAAFPYPIERLPAPTLSSSTLSQQQQSSSSSSQQQPSSSSSQQQEPRSVVPPASLASPSSLFSSKVLPALDAEMVRVSEGDCQNSIPAEYQFNEDLLKDVSVVPVAQRLQRLERRKPKVPNPMEARQPFYLRNPRIATYPLPLPPQSSIYQEENARLLSKAMAPQTITPAVHYSALGTILSSASITSSSASSSSETTTATTVPNSPVLSQSTSSASSASPSINTNILHSHPTDPVELLSRLGSRSSPGVASPFHVLVACLKRVLPNHAVTDSCQFLVDELTPRGLERAHSSLNSLETVANRFREVVGEELTVRHDALRRRESSLISSWEDEYLANAREDKKVEAEMAELLHGRRPSPSPPPSPRHERPYFVSSTALSGLRAPPTSRIGPAPPQSSSHVAPPTTSPPSSTRVGSPTPPPSELDVDSSTSYHPPPGLSRKRRRFTPPPPPSSPVETRPTATASGPVIWDDVDMASVDPGEPEVDEEKVIASAFYQDLARDLSVDPSLDRAMVRALSQLAEGTPIDVLNHCVDAILEEAGS
ncbi:hypothetical protein BDZ89DRAFT_1133555 [Hymenopellis radicata]|nr:hypothetical protein BDZ89DRAFT_1133555 [Hymenopellis radicata]